MAGEIVTALENIDYPRAKLDIKFVVERDDTDTRDALARAEPPAGMHARDGVCSGFVTDAVADGIEIGEAFARGEINHIQTPTFSRLITMPALSRSQVSDVTPSLRRRCFCTFCVGVFGRSGPTRT